MFSAFQTFGRLGAGARAVAAAWSPLALWPDGISSAGMWISPSTLDASYQDSTGTTPVATPGTVADSANPVGLALDLRLGAPTTLGPELCVGPPVDLGSWTNNGDGTFAAPASSSYINWYAGGVAGKTYLVTITITNYSSGWVANHQDSIWVPFADANGTFTALLTPGFGTMFYGGGSFNAAFSVKEIPGNHMLQASTTARPLESARVNLLTYTEDFTNAVWTVYEASKTPNSGTAPDGTTTACLVKESTATSQHVLGGPSFGAITAGTPCNIPWYVKNAGVDYVLITFDGPGGYASATFDLVNGAFVRGNHLGGDMYVPGSATVESVAGGYLRIAASFIASATGAWSSSIKLNRPNINSQDPSYAGDGTSGLYIWHPQAELGLTATPYQSVPTDGSTYSSTGITPFQLYDGTDDGMATASFAAGTLTSGMDCLIAVRRDSVANAVCGLYESVSDANKVFGIAESGSSSGCVGSGAGTPTVWVDGTQLTGGTTVTRNTLHTALTVGDWHILEFRNLDLSTWTASGFGLYTSYKLLGGRSDIMLFPSPADATERDKARAYLADLYGVTLP